MPTMNWASRLSKGTMIASGMGMISNERRTTELKVAPIQILSRTQCRAVEDLGVYFKGIGICISMDHTVWIKTASKLILKTLILGKIIFR